MTPMLQASNATTGPAHLRAGAGGGAALRAAGKLAEQITKAQQHRHRRPPQQGFLMAEFGLVMIVMTLVVLALVQAMAKIHQMDRARTQADTLEAVRAHAHRLVMSRYRDYQSGRGFVFGTITFVSGDAAGQSRRPTMAQMRTLFPALAQVPDTGQFKTLVQARYDIRIARTAQCDIDPLAEACQVTGMVCLDQPLTELSGDFDAEGITHIMGRIGGHAGVSLPTQPATVFGEADWRSPNPYGARAAIVCARLGWGADTTTGGGVGVGEPVDIEAFLRVRDVRDPQFQNNRFSLRGSLFTGPDATQGGCGLAEILNSGQVLVRAANCVRRVWMDGATGQIGVADAQGVPKVILEVDAGSGQGQVIADTVRTPNFESFMINNGFYGDTGQFREVRADQATFSASLTLPYEEVIGTLCNQEGGLAWGKYASGSPRRVLARCHVNPGTTAPVWTFIGGLQEAQWNAPCSSVSDLAVTPANESLYCSGGKWGYLPDRMGHSVLYDSRYVETGVPRGVLPSVEFPTCLDGATMPSIFLLPAIEEQSIQRVTRYAVIVPGGWQVFVVDGQGNNVPGAVIAHVYCNYW